jgi:1-acyl-sn-glycerol-3-phosphate acyltransferase
MFERGCDGYSALSAEYAYIIHLSYLMTVCLLIIILLLLLFFFFRITVLGEPQPFPEFSSTVLGPATYASSSSGPRSLDLSQLTKVT